MGMNKTLWHGRSLARIDTLIHAHTHTRPQTQTFIRQSNKENRVEQNNRPLAWCVCIESMQALIRGGMGHRGKKRLLLYYMWYGNGYNWVRIVRYAVVVLCKLWQQNSINLDKPNGESQIKLIIDGYVYLPVVRSFVRSFFFLPFSRFKMIQSFFRINWHENESVCRLFCYLFILLCDVSNLKLARNAQNVCRQITSHFRCRTVRTPVTE